MLYGQIIPRFEAIERIFEVQKNFDRITDSFLSSGVFEAIERVQAMNEEFTKSRERVLEMCAFPFVWSKPHISPPRRQEVDEDRIARSVSRRVIACIERHNLDHGSKMVVLRIRGNEVLHITAAGAKRMEVNERSLKLLVSLSPQFTKTQELKDLSGYRNTQTVQQTMIKLKQKLKAVFDLDSYPIEGASGRGYRIAEGYLLIVET